MVTMATVEIAGHMTLCGCTRCRTTPKHADWCTVLRCCHLMLLCLMLNSCLLAYPVVMGQLIVLPHFKAESCFNGTGHRGGWYNNKQHTCWEMCYDMYLSISFRLVEWILIVINITTDPITLSGAALTWAVNNRQIQTCHCMFLQQNKYTFAWEK